MRIEIERTGDLPPVAGGVGLLHISPQGVRLLAPACLQLREPIVLRIEIPSLKRTLSPSANVRWRQPAPEGAWRLGCAFSQELPEDVVEGLTLLGHIGRQSDRRRVADANSAVTPAPTDAAGGQSVFRWTVLVALPAVLLAAFFLLR